MIRTGIAYVDTLEIKGEAVTVPKVDTPSWVTYGGGYAKNVINMYVYMDQPGTVFAMFSCRQGYTSGSQNVQFEMVMDGRTVYSGSSSAYADYVTISHAIGVGRGYCYIKVYWDAPSSVSMGNRSCFAMGVKR